MDIICCQLCGYLCRYHLLPALWIPVWISSVTSSVDTCVDIICCQLCGYLCGYHLLPALWIPMWCHLLPTLWIPVRISSDANSVDTCVDIICCYCSVYIIYRYLCGFRLSLALWISSVKTLNSHRAREPIRHRMWGSLGLYYPIMMSATQPIYLFHGNFQLAMSSPNTVNQPISYNKQLPVV